MNKAIFIDRDGVINKERGDYTWKINDFVILPDVITALTILKEKGFKLIVITNQGGIAKGLYSYDEFLTLNSFMLSQLNAKQTLIDEVFLCPHHPSHGACLCRKPESLMLEKAMARFQIDANQSWMIGDQDRDVQAAQKLGIKSLKIESNSSLLSILEKIC